MPSVDATNAQSTVAVTTHHTSGAFAWPSSMGIVAAAAHGAMTATDCATTSVNPRLRRSSPTNWVRAPRRSRARTRSLAGPGIARTLTTACFRRVTRWCCGRDTQRVSASSVVPRRCPDVLPRGNDAATGRSEHICTGIDAQSSRHLLARFLARCRPSDRRRESHDIYR